MKRIFHLLCVLLAALSCKPSSDAVMTEIPYTNPILHLDYSDPDVCRVGDTFYMTASSFNCFPGLPVLESSDLVHWNLISYALADYPCDNSGDSFRGTVRHGEGVWAPSIRYHDGWFYIFVGDPDRGVFMVRSRSAEGPWEKPVWLVREKGFIDPCPLWDSSGNAWLSHACAGSRAGLKSVLFVAPMSADGTSLLGPSRIVFDGHLTQPTIEGTKFYERSGWYYIFAPAGGVSTGWQTVLRSRSVYGPYEERVVMAWAPGTVNGPHQGGWVSALDGTDWFLHFQDKGAYGRVVHLQPMSWRADGWPVIGSDPDGDGVGQPVASFCVPSSSRSSSLRENEGKCVTGTTAVAGVTQKGPEMRNANDYGLGLDWQYPAVPEPYYHMALPDGGVRLYSVLQGNSGLWNCPNLLQQKFPAESFSVTTSLVFKPNPQLADGSESAGFVVMGESYAGLKLVSAGQTAKLQYVTCEDAHKGTAEVTSFIAEVPAQPIAVDDSYASGNVPAVKYKDYLESTVWVKLDVAPQYQDGAESGIPDAVCSFSWSLDGENFVKAGPDFIAAPGRWIGAKFGFFCNRYAPKNDAGSLDILDLEITLPGAELNCK